MYPSLGYYVCRKLLAQKVSASVQIEIDAKWTSWIDSYYIILVIPTKNSFRVSQSKHDTTLNNYRDKLLASEDKLYGSIRNCSEF